MAGPLMAIYCVLEANNRMISKLVYNSEIGLQFVLVHVVRGFIVEGVMDAFFIVPAHKVL